MTLGARIGRTGGAPSLVRPSSLTGYYVPTPDDLVKIPDISGNLRHAPYNNAPNAGQFTRKPPELRFNSAVGQATTPIFAATRPASFTIQLWAKIVNNAGTYLAGTPTGGESFIRATVGDLRAYVIASDGTGNFLVSNNQTPAVGSWILFSLVCAPNLFQLYQGKTVVATLAGKTARADANFAYRFDYSGSGANTMGACLIYSGRALTGAEVAQNLAYMRAAHGYP